MKRLLLFVLLALAAGGYYYYTSLKKGPEYALLQAAAATQTHDLAAFERYVDVDALTSHLVDDVADHSGVLAALVPGGGLALRGGLRLLKPQLTKAAHNEVQRYVETGSLEAAQAAAPKRLVNLSLLGLAGRVVSPDSKFKGIKYSTDKGNEALVGLEFSQPRYDTTMVVEVKLLKQADGHWQAKQITNADELVAGVARLEKNHLLNSH
ncbi:hypothetical protein GCM10023172_25520 [Hymenobacter ginsengisoli]|uniref:DUF2939 domain-containing protein n=1 Tax=Hymenobacter ginsengisoli TaxID=1051626 RepID=A0ABP8QFN9_9BACT|nr:MULTISPECIES: hypothetical protein [unclassified Hymenobacter]MBO2030189.1 hypothetical protein [Hymenobacter sp. BT559]